MSKYVVGDPEEHWVLSPERDAQSDRVSCASIQIQVLMETYDTQDEPNFLF